MKLIFNKNFIIIESVIMMIASICISIKSHDIRNGVQLAIFSIFMVKTAYCQENWKRVIQYRKSNNTGYILAVLGSYIAAMVFVGLAFYQPVLHERLDAGFTNTFLHILRAAEFIILGVLCCLTIKFDNMVEEKIRSSIKCSSFEENSSCHSTSCINCKYACEENISINERIKIELIKDEKYYSKKLDYRFERLIKFEGRESDIAALENILKDDYEKEVFDDSFLKRY